MRAPGNPLLLLTLLPMLAACPPVQAPGDVQYGEYLVDAVRQAEGCAFTPDVEQAETFDFWARLGADLDGETAYLTVAQPPGNVQQRPRQGDVVDGGFAFETAEFQDVQACDCLVRVTETLTFLPETGGADGGSAGADGGSADPDGGVPNLPPAAALTGVTGEIVYLMESAGNCPEPELDADGGVVSGCVLPCRWGYDLTGERQD